MTRKVASETELVDMAAAAHNVAVKAPLQPGGQKLVYLVEDAAGGTAVLKVVRVDESGGHEALKRAYREASLLAEISHDSIVRGLTPAKELGRPIQAISWLEEYLDGEDLRALLGPIWSWDETRQMARGITSGLSILHERGVVHRDLSAGNVMRLRSGGYKILDPGFAKHVNLSGLTGLHQPGTMGFISPEHVQFGLVPTYASDVFCVGILMWFALVGDFPLDPSDPVAYVRNLAEGQVPSIRTRRSDLSRPQAGVVDRCLQRQVARRYLDAGECLFDLEAL